MNTLFRTKILSTIVLSGILGAGLSANAADLYMNNDQLKMDRTVLPIK